MDRTRLASLLDEERELHRSRNPRSFEQFSRADHLFTGVPMTWMANWAGGFPLALDRAKGAAGLRCRRALLCRLRAG